MLPKGVGEASVSRKLEEEKILRLSDRRKKALAAIEREKKRRAMTEEERERIRMELCEGNQLARDAQEATLYNAAMAALITHRNTTSKINNIKEVVQKEVTDLVELFRALSDLVFSRYPSSSKAAICLNNLYSVNYEVKKLMVKKLMSLLFF